MTGWYPGEEAQEALAQDLAHVLLGMPAAQKLLGDLRQLGDVLEPRRRVGMPSKSVPGRRRPLPRCRSRARCGPRPSSSPSACAPGPTSGACPAPPAGAWGRPSTAPRPQVLGPDALHGGLHGVHVGWSGGRGDVDHDHAALGRDALDLVVGEVAWHVRERPA
jgi:hypothetical protein